MCKLVTLWNAGHVISSSAVAIFKLVRVHIYSLNILPTFITRLFLVCMQKNKWAWVVWGYMPGSTVPQHPALFVQFYSTFHTISSTNKRFLGHWSHMGTNCILFCWCCTCVVLQLQLQSALLNATSLAGVSQSPLIAGVCTNMSEAICSGSI